MSTYSPSLRIELITNGTQAGVWGDTTNNNLAYVLDSAIAGYQTVSVINPSQALTYTSGPTSTASANQSVYAMLRFTTTTGAAFAVYAPPVSKVYIVWNNSGQTMTIYNSTVIGNTTAAGTGVAVANGDKVLVWSDATNFYEIKAGGVSSTVAIANGGTGQTTASAAINALLPTQTGNANKYLQTNGTAASWDAVDISTADVSGTLAIANGGSGQTTAQLAMNAFAGAVTSGSYLRGNGTNVVMATIQAADVPTLNQNTTGTAGNVSGIVAVANGGTGVATLTANNVLLGNGTSSPQAVAPGTSGNLLTSNGTTWVSAAPVAPDVQTFASTSTWTKPTGGQTMARIMCWGGGGGGANNSTGGGGGGYNEQIVPISWLASTVTVTVGAGGGIGSSVGSNGGTSSFPLATSFNGRSAVAAGGGGGGGGATSSISGSLTPYIWHGGTNQGDAYGAYAGGGGGTSGGDSAWGGTGGVPATNGTAPGGGGGSGDYPSAAGAGAVGRVVVMCW